MTYTNHTLNLLYDSFLHLETYFINRFPFFFVSYLFFIILVTVCSLSDFLKKKKNRRKIIMKQSTIQDTCLMFSWLGTLRRENWKIKKRKIICFLLCITKTYILILTMYKSRFVMEWRKNCVRITYLLFLQSSKLLSWVKKLKYSFFFHFYFIIKANRCTTWNKS